MAFLVTSCHFLRMSVSVCHAVTADMVSPSQHQGYIPEETGETELTFACSRLALAIFSRPEHTSLLPPSTAHRLFWAPAKDTAPVTHTPSAIKPINSCPRTFLFFRSHRPSAPLTFLSSILFLTPYSSLSVCFFFLFLSSLLTYISANVGVRTISGPNFSCPAFLFPLSSLYLSCTSSAYSFFTAYFFTLL